jgi:hypothetical protein
MCLEGKILVKADESRNSLGIGIFLVFLENHHKWEGGQSRLNGFDSNPG